MEIHCYSLDYCLLINRSKYCYFHPCYFFYYFVTDRLPTMSFYLDFPDYRSLGDCASMWTSPNEGIVTT